MTIPPVLPMRSTRLQRAAVEEGRSMVQVLQRRPCESPSLSLSAWRLYFFLLSVCLGTAGCFPYHYTVRPGVVGTVLSADTRQPVAGVGILFGRTNVTELAQTAADGSFSIPPRRQWGIWIIPQDVFALRWTVCIRRAGYETNCTEFLFSAAATGKSAEKRLGEISLKPLSP